jgi:hypothetical protein
MKCRLLSLLVGGLVTVGVGVGHAQDVTQGNHLQANLAKIGAKAQITAEQRAMLAEKLARIDAIIRAAEADANAPISAEKARWMRESLYQLPLAQIKTIQPSGNSQATSDAILRASKVDTKALGSASSDLVFRPWAPCRYIDTRNVGGKITGARGYDTFLSGTSHGGVAACNPRTLAGVTDENDIAAFALNVTVVDTSTAAAPGFMTMRPAGSTSVSALVNWTVSSAGFQLGNAAVITVDQTVTNEELEIFTSGAVHAIVDLAGAFVAPAATPLQCTTATASYTIAVNSTITQFFGHAACPTGYTKVGASCRQGADIDVYLMETGPNGCTYRNLGTGTAPGASETYCCRVPGL